MISRKRFISVATVAALVGLGSSALITLRGIDPGPMSRAAWAFKADSLRSLAQTADVIVLARAAAVHPGRVAINETGEDRLPFQLVELETLRALKGAPGATLFVERAGGLDPFDGTWVEIDADGGEFLRGETYLLFLEPQENDTGYHYQINDQGRFVLRGASLAAVADEDDPVAASLHGQELSQAIDLVQQALQ